MTYDIEINLVDCDTGEVIFKSKKMPFTVGCYDKSVFYKYIDCFIRGISSNRSLSLSISAFRPVAVQLDIF